MSSRDIPLPPKTVAQLRAKKMKRISDHVPQRKRTCHADLSKDTEQHVASVPKIVPEDKDAILKRILSNVPRRKRTCPADPSEDTEQQVASVPKIVPEDKDVMLKRNLSNVPRRKRTCPADLSEDTEQRVASVPKIVPEDKDVILKRILSNVPGRKRTTYEYIRPKDPQDSPKTPPEWLVQVMRRMNGAGEPKLIIEKTLDPNDVDPRQNCLSIPIRSVIQNGFLTHDESVLIYITNEANMGVGAVLVDQRTKQWNVGFKRRSMTTDLGSTYWSFGLHGEWSDVVETNKLKQGDKISLWSFRSGEILCFALVPPTSSVFDSVDK